MKECIAVMDTNILRNQNIKSLPKFINKVEKNIGTPFIHEVVLDELVKYQMNKLKTEIIDKFDENELYATIFNFESNFADIISKAKIKFTDFYLELFNGKTIKRDNIDFEELYYMSINKIPPFQSEPGKSDQGFKDALLWLSLRNIKEYDVVLITNDSGFTKHKENFETEFLRVTGHNLSIISEIPDKNIEGSLNNYKVTSTLTSKFDKDKNIVQVYKNIEKFRVDLDQILENIVYEDIFSAYGFPDKDVRFSLYSAIEKFEFEVLLESLEKFIEENLVSPVCSTESFLFNVFGISELSSKYALPTEIIVNFYDLLRKFNVEFPEYTSYIFKTIIDYINRRTYVELNNTFDDSNIELPF